MAPVCAKCKKTVVGSVVQALDASFCKSCLTCRDCNRNVLGEAFYEVDGLPQCESCQEKSQVKQDTPSCKVCRKNIEGDYTKAFGLSFHNACMKCGVCSKMLNNDGFYDDETDQILHLTCLAALDD